MEQTYKVQAGDTLSQIAKKYGTNVGIFARLNNIADVNKIKAGQVLKLPSSIGANKNFPTGQNVSIPKVIDSNYLNPSPTPNIPTVTPKTVNVVNSKDNQDGTTTNFLSDGSKSTVRYTPNEDGSLTPTEVPYNAADEILRASVVPDSEAQTAASSLSTSIYNLLPKLAGETAATAEEMERAGVGELRKSLQDINSQILKKQAELAQDDIKLIASMRDEERRDTLRPFAESSKEKLAGDAAIMRALKSSEIGVLNAVAIGRQGDIELATETAKDAVALKYAPYKEAISIYQAQLEALSPILTRDEKKQAYEQNVRGNIAMKEIEKAQKDEEDAKTLTLDLMKNGAPQSVINAALKAKSKGEIQAIPGISNYLLSQGEKLDLALKREALTKAKRENSGGTDKLLSVDDAIKLGVPYGTTESQAAAMGKSTPNIQKENERLALEDKISSIDALIKHKGLAQSVGSTFLFGRDSVKGAFTPGRKQDFIAGVQQLVSKDTLDTLLNLKKAGGTLGALSEGEARMLQSAATKIGTWAIKDKGGNVLGYKANEKSFKKELETIKTLTTRALNAAGGPVSSGNDVSSYLDLVDSALQFSNNPYANAGYDLK